MKLHAEDDDFTLRQRNFKKKRENCTVLRNSSILFSRTFLPSVIYFLPSGPKTAGIVCGGVKRESERERGGPAGEKLITGFCVCMCVRVCVRARVCVCFGWTYSEVASPGHDAEVDVLAAMRGN